jgi:hypothetical protein
MPEQTLDPGYFSFWGNFLFDHATQDYLRLMLLTKCLLREGKC